MILEINIPRPGESINEVVISKWLVADGAFVNKDQEVAEVESDKATLPLIASASGQIKILISEGTTVGVGKVACTIDTDKVVSKKLKVESNENPLLNNEAQSSKLEAQSTKHEIKTTPVAEKLMEEYNLSVDDIINGLQRIGKKEVEAVFRLKNTTPVAKKISIREEKREPMSPLRKKLSKRLVSVKNETAMLTTFNEADMSGIIVLRNQYQKAFFEKHGLKLGFMSFFTKAVSIALKQFPKVNSQIEGEEIVTPDYCDIGIAVQTDKGLMVPILRNAESMSIAEIEKAIAEKATKARAARLSIDDMTGGTFTITNGGVFGSLLSTPIINPPQSAILGMHNIVERPVAISGLVVIRPMMYIALSYDHRIIDGRDSVSFLVKVKELVENPLKLLYNTPSPEKELLGI